MPAADYYDAAIGHADGDRTGDDPDGAGDRDRNSAGHLFADPVGDSDSHDDPHPTRDPYHHTVNAIAVANSRYPHPFSYAEPHGNVYADPVGLSHRAPAELYANRDPHDHTIAHGNSDAAARPNCHAVIPHRDPVDHM